jgi:hypothetical protein
VDNIQGVQPVTVVLDQGVNLLVKFADGGNRPVSKNAVRPEPRKVNPPDWTPPRGTFSVLSEAGLRELFPGMRRETSQLLVDEADDGYAPESPDTLGRFHALVRDPFTGALESGAAYKVTRQDDGTYLVTETARDERE